MSDLPRLEALLEGLARPRVLIVGDVIMDRYVFGDVGRISPEAPIPVLAARRNELRLGGAGNVAANLSRMEAEVRVVGVVGDDGHGRAMAEAFERSGIEARLTIDRSRPTIEKTRMMSGVQQMLRVDWEDPRDVEGEVLAALLAAAEEGLSGAAAVVLSDYGKGTLPPAVVERVIRSARARGIPVLVDPKGSDYARYRGATLITPNKKEAEQAVGRKLVSPEDLARAARELIELAALDLVVITLGSEGIYFRTAGEGAAAREHRAPAVARAVFDVTGAGDTVVAHLALYLAARWDIEDAVTMANVAAGIVVGKLGTHAVTRAELASRLADSLPHEGKVLDEGSLGGMLESWRRERKRIVFTNGCFDVLHVGHVEYLRFARLRGDVLLVGVNSDASIARLKGPERPVNPLEDRMKVLAALEMVDAVVPFDADTPLALIERVTPDVLVKGEDWADKGVVGREWVEGHGGRVVLAPLVPGRSTTAILERARGGGARTAE